MDAENTKNKKKNFTINLIALDNYFFARKLKSFVIK